MNRSNEILQISLIGLLVVNIAATSTLLYIGYGIQRDIRRVKGRFSQAGEVAGDTYMLVAGSALDKVLTVNKYGQMIYQTIGGYCSGLWTNKETLSYNDEESEESSEIGLEEI